LRTSGRFEPASICRAWSLRRLKGAWIAAILACAGQARQRRICRQPSPFGMQPGDGQRERERCIASGFGAISVPRMDDEASGLQTIKPRNVAACRAAIQNGRQGSVRRVRGRSGTVRSLSRFASRVHTRVIPAARWRGVRESAAAARGRYRAHDSTPVAQSRRRMKTAWLASRARPPTIHPPC
jgi:hypothetical protein